MIMRAADNVSVIHLICPEQGRNVALRNHREKYVHIDNLAGQLDDKTGLTEPPQCHRSTGQRQIPNLLAQCVRCRRDASCV
jgi:hypothetical protein